MPMGRDEKFTEAGDAALSICPNEKMTCEMYEAASPCILEIYRPTLNTESDLLLTDDKLRARVGSGFGLLRNVTTEAKSL